MPAGPPTPQFAKALSQQASQVAGVTPQTPQFLPSQVSTPTQQVAQAPPKNAGGQTTAQTAAQKWANQWSPSQWSQQASKKKSAPTGNPQLMQAALETQIQQHNLAAAQAQAKATGGQLQSTGTPGYWNVIPGSGQAQQTPTPVQQQPAPVQQQPQPVQQQPQPVQQQPTPYQPPQQQQQGGTAGGGQVYAIGNPNGD